MTDISFKISPESVKAEKKIMTIVGFIIFIPAYFIFMFTINFLFSLLPAYDQHKNIYGVLSYVIPAVCFILLVVMTKGNEITEVRINDEHIELRTGKSRKIILPYADLQSCVIARSNNGISVITLKTTGKTYYIGRFQDIERFGFQLKRQMENKNIKLEEKLVKLDPEQWDSKKENR